jgi:hypothetical protein
VFRLLCLLSVLSALGPVVGQTSYSGGIGAVPRMTPVPQPEISPEPGWKLPERSYGDYISRVWYKLGQLEQISNGRWKWHFKVKYSMPVDTELYGVTNSVSELGLVCGTDKVDKESVAYFHDVRLGQEIETSCDYSARPASFSLTVRSFKPPKWSDYKTAGQDIMVGYALLIDDNPLLKDGCQIEVHLYIKEALIGSQTDVRFILFSIGRALSSYNYADAVWENAHTEEFVRLKYAWPGAGPDCTHIMLNGFREKHATFVVPKDSIYKSRK